MERQIAHVLANMVPAPAGIAAAKKIFETEDGILLAYGTTFPADASVGYAPGCLFIRTDASSLDAALYVNIGTKASSNFDAAVMAS